jgi:hypothetical protein
MESLQSNNDNKMLQGWLGVLLSSTACIIGGKNHIAIYI